MRAIRCQLCGVECVCMQLDYKKLPSWEDGSSVLIKRCEFIEINEDKRHVDSNTSNNRGSNSNNSRNNNGNNNFRSNNNSNSSYSYACVEDRRSPLPLDDHHLWRSPGGCTWQSCGEWKLFRHLRFYLCQVLSGYSWMSASVCSCSLVLSLG